MNSYRQTIGHMVVRLSGKIKRIFSNQRSCSDKCIDTPLGR